MNWQGQTILAPLTKGGNLPYRRLCVEFGAEITTSEMAYARQINRRSRAELALLRKHPSEMCFGVQLAAGKAPDAISAGRRAIDQGAVFVDLNCGCPIHDVVKRGMGATLLQRPAALGRIVEAMVEGLSVPVTVKIRSGWKADKSNASEVARIIEEAGAAAITIHPRSREQRYSKAADWGLVRQLVEERNIPVIGNGDILTYYEAERVRRESGCAALMVARGALIKPWIFQEIAQGQAWEPTAEERVEVYHRLAGYMKEHFYDDEKGKERAMRFLPWHFGFFWRYRPLPESEFGERSLQYPLMQTRRESDGELPLLEGVLRDPREEVHARLADSLWEAATGDEALQAVTAIGEELPPVTELPDTGRGTQEIATSHG
jgi:tRNA-dihydrouridine synthase 3